MAKLNLFAALACACLATGQAALAFELTAFIETTHPILPASRRAAISSTQWEEHLKSGYDALAHRLFEKARAQLSAGLPELQRHHQSHPLIVQAKAGLAEAYLGLEQYDRALRLFEETLEQATQPQEKETRLAALAGAAEAAARLHQLGRCESLCRQALAVCQTDAPTSARQHARIQAVLGDIACQQGLRETAIEDYRRAIRLYDGSASAFYQQALITQKLAVQLRETSAEQAQPLFAAAFATIDKQCRFNVPSRLAPRVVVDWDAGNPRSRLIADPVYPLKYELINGLRVAATPVRSKNVIAVIVSLANCTESRMQLAVGPVELQQVAPKHRSFTFVSASELDMPLEEQHVTELTWRRAWLNHIEKTRLIPGYLKDNRLDVDNFFGNNLFGAYGDWQTIACSETPLVTREQFYYGRERADDVATQNFLSQDEELFKPTYLDPGEAETGLVFFQRERYDKLTLLVDVGNTVVEIPFDDTTRQEGF